MRPLYPDNVPAAVFLLPYLIRDVLRGGENAVADAVLAELMCVLGEYTAVAATATTPADDGAPTGAKPRLIGFIHRARQAVFSLMDTLASWLGRAAQPSDAGAAATKATGRRAAPRREDVSPLQWLLHAVPQRSLAEAALDCGAHARALRHLELSMRELGGVSGVTTPSLPPP